MLLLRAKFIYQRMRVFVLVQLLLMMTLLSGFLLGVKVKAILKLANGEW